MFTNSVVCPLPPHPLGSIHSRGAGRAQHVKVGGRGRAQAWGWLEQQGESCQVMMW